MHDVPSPAAGRDPVAAMDELERELEAQHAALGRLADLARRQAAFVEEGRTDALVGLLAERGRLVDAFVAGQVRVAELAGLVAEDPAAVPADRRAGVDARVREIEAALAAVLERDAADQARLEERRGEARRRLEAVDAGRSALAAYGGGPGARPGPRLADRRG